MIKKKKKVEKKSKRRRKSKGEFVSKERIKEVEFKHKLMDNRLRRVMKLDD